MRDNPHSGRPQPVGLTPRCTLTPSRSGVSSGPRSLVHSRWPPAPISLLAGRRSKRRERLQACSCLRIMAPSLVKSALWIDDRCRRSPRSGGEVRAHRFTDLPEQSARRGARSGGRPGARGARRGASSRPPWTEEPVCADIHSRLAGKQAGAPNTVTGTRAAADRSHRVCTSGSAPHVAASSTALGAGERRLGEEWVGNHRILTGRP
jgi:hypothetical protein